MIGATGRYGFQSRLFRNTGSFMNTCNTKVTSETGTEPHFIYLIGLRPHDSPFFDLDICLGSRQDEI